MDDPAPGQCDINSLKGGGTGWLTTSGNVQPGETMKLRIAIWDTSDHAYDSLAVIDGFKWSADTSMPGTVIFRSANEPPANRSRSRQCTSRCRHGLSSVERTAAAGRGSRTHDVDSRCDDEGRWLPGCRRTPVGTRT
jgi:hypothetical protein